MDSNQNNVKWGGVKSEFKARWSKAAKQTPTTEPGPNPADKRNPIDPVIFLEIYSFRGI